MDSFETVFKYLRLRENLTQEELAKKLGVSKSTISMYENGNRKPDYESLENIADFFNVDMNFLTARTEPDKDEDPLMVVAAHHSDYEFSEKQLKEIDRFINFVKQQEEQEDK